MIILRQKEYARKDYLVSSDDKMDDLYNKYVAGKRRAIAMGLLKKRASVNIPGVSIEERNKTYNHVLEVAKKDKDKLNFDVWVKETPMSIKEKMAERPEIYEKGYKESWIRKPQPQQVNTPPPVTSKVEVPKTSTSSPKIKGKGGGWKKAVAGTLLAAPLITGGLYLNKLSGNLNKENNTKTFSDREKVPAEIENKARKQGVIQKDSKGVWRIISLKTHPAEYWDAHYKTREDAEKALGAYHANK